MTPKAFETAIRRWPCEQFVTAVNKLVEAERKPLFAVVKAVEKDIARERDFSTELGTAKEWQKRQAAVQAWQARNPFVESNLAFAILACGSAADAHKVRPWSIRFEDRALLSSVLVARNPAWLETWVRNRLDGASPELTWETVRALMKAGVIERPRSLGYISLFIEAMRGFVHQNVESYVPTSERLRREPELLEIEIWQIFEFENHALTTDWYARTKNAPADYETWPDALVRLAREGDIDRQRLLDTTLHSMQAEMKQNQLAAYGKLHAALDPTAEEMAARQDGYRALLVSPTGPVVAFAIRMLEKTHRSGALEAEPFLEAVHPVFALKAKGSAVRALGLVSKLHRESAASASMIAAAATAAMAHESPDVQSLALTILEKVIPDTTSESRKEVERRIPFLAPKLQDSAFEMLGIRDETDTRQEPIAIPATAEFSVPENIPQALLELAGVSDGIDCAMPPPLRFDPLQLPCVAERNRLVPVTSRDELLELAAQLLEHVGSAASVELLLDGIARFGRDRGGNFEKLARPLVQRVEQGQTSSDGLCAGWDAIRTALADLLMTWWTDRHYDSRRAAFLEDTPQTAFAVARIREIQALLLSGNSHSLVSLPSYDSGWLEPGDFVNRILALASGTEPGDLDLMQALLRLGPGERRKFYDAARKLEGRAGRLAQFALGGDVWPTWTDRGDAHLWFCAARARDPLMKDVEKLGAAGRKVPRLPGGVHADCWDWSVVVREANGYRNASIAFDGGVSFVERGFTFKRNRAQKILRKLKEPAWHKWPTVGLRTWPDQRWAAMSQFNATWKIEWLAMQNPADTESFMSVAACVLDFRSDQGTSRDEPAHAFLSTLFDPTRPWGEVAHLAVCLGLLSRSPDSRGYAIDALIPAIETGHADEQRMAEIFSKLLADGAYKINRFGPAMTAVLEVSDLHKWWVARVIDLLVVQFQVLPKGVHCLYEAALEAMLPLKVRPSDVMGSLLKAHQGSSKTARLAKELLSLDGPTIDEPQVALVNAARSGRLQFAQRFAAANARPR